MFSLCNQSIPPVFVSHLTTISLGREDKQRMKVCAGRRTWRGVWLAKAFVVLVAPPFSSGLKALWFAFRCAWSIQCLRHRKERTSAPPYSTTQRNAWRWTLSKGIQFASLLRLPVARQMFLVIDFFLEFWNLFDKSESLSFFFDSSTKAYLSKKALHVLDRLTHWEGQQKSESFSFTASLCTWRNGRHCRRDAVASQFINRRVLAESPFGLLSPIIWFNCSNSKKKWVILLEFYDTKIKSIEVLQKRCALKRISFGFTLKLIFMLVFII